MSGNRAIYGVRDASGRYSLLSNSTASVQYAYNPDGSEAGFTIRLSNGMVFARTVCRDDNHPGRIGAISNCASGALVEDFIYAYDSPGRSTARNNDTFGYNERSEVIASRRGAENTEDVYAYDDIGNLLFSCAGADTNSYAADNLNQYTSILRVSAPPYPEMKNFVKGFSKEMHGVMVSGNKKYTLSDFGLSGGLSAFGFERAYLNGKEIGWPSTLLH